MWKKGLIYIICCCILCVGLMGCGNGQEKKIDKLLKQASRYLEELDFEEAIRIYTDILEIDERTKEALGGIAHAYIEWAEQEDFDSALDKLDTAISYAEEAFHLYLDDEDFADLLFAAYTKAGIMCEENGRIEEAIWYYKKASEIKEDESTQSKLDNLEKQRNKEKEEATDVEEPDWEYLELLSQIFQGNGNYLSDEDKALLCDPLVDELIEYVNKTENADGFFYLAEMYRITGKLDKCIEARKEGFQKTHVDRLNPEGYKGTDHSGNFVLYNQYNQAVEYNGKRSLTYDGDKVVKTDNEYATENIEYDAQGRMIKNITEYKDEEEQEDIFVYEYDIPNHKVYIYDSTSPMGFEQVFRDITYDQYGRPLKEIVYSYMGDTTDKVHWENVEFFLESIYTWEYSEDGSYDWTMTEYDVDGTVLDYRTSHVNG